jgi:hypothetical protein
MNCLLNRHAREDSINSQFLQEKEKLRTVDIKAEIVYPCYSLIGDLPAW